MLTYLKPGDIYQKNDVMEFPADLGGAGIAPIVIMRSGGVVAAGDMIFKPRRWRLDADCLYMTLPGWAWLPGALNE